MVAAAALRAPRRSRRGPAAALEPHVLISRHSCARPTLSRPEGISRHRPHSYKQCPGLDAYPTLGIALKIVGGEILARWNGSGRFEPARPIRRARDGGTRRCAEGASRAQSAPMANTGPGSDRADGEHRVAGGPGHVVVADPDGPGRAVAAPARVRLPHGDVRAGVEARAAAGHAPARRTRRRGAVGLPGRHRVGRGRDDQISRTGASAGAARARRPRWTGGSALPAELRTGVAADVAQPDRAVLDVGRCDRSGAELPGPDAVARQHCLREGRAAERDHEREERDGHRWRRGRAPSKNPHRYSPIGLCGAYVTVMCVGFGAYWLIGGLVYERRPARVRPSRIPVTAVSAEPLVSQNSCSTHGIRSDGANGDRAARRAGGDGRSTAAVRRLQRPFGSTTPSVGRHWTAGRDSLSSL